MSEWTNEKEKKVLWKYRFLLTVRVVRVILILIFSYWIYLVVATIVYDQTKLSEKHEFHIKLAIDWIQAGYSAGDEGMGTEEVTPFLSHHMSLPINRTIGKEEKAVGTINFTKRVLTPLSKREIHYTNISDESPFHFYLPKDPRNGKKLGLAKDFGVWEALDKVHEGTVADLAFSTTDFFKPEELVKLLEKYELDVIWMPLYAGELKEIEDVSYSIAGGSYLEVEKLGMSRASQTDDYQSFTRFQLSSDTLKENEKVMLSNMHQLIKNESTSYLEDFLGLRHMNERYNYLKKNGFKVYGAVVTGPVKELLKLKGNKEIQGVQLGEFDYWNWENGK